MKDDKTRADHSIKIEKILQKNIFGGGLRRHIVQQLWTIYAIAHILITCICGSRIFWGKCPNEIELGCFLIIYQV